jgi:hypothetical protein
MVRANSDDDIHERSGAAEGRILHTTMALYEEHRIPASEDCFMRLLAWEASRLWGAWITERAALENDIFSSPGKSEARYPGIELGDGIGAESGQP